MNMNNDESAEGVLLGYSHQLIEIGSSEPEILTLRARVVWEYSE
jgi:hypothetical protein